MQALFAVCRREVRAYLNSPATYVLWAFFLVLMGVGFGLLVIAMAEGLPAQTLTRALYGDNPFLWLGLLVTAPMLTMRSFAEEKRSGTMETLMTAPVADWAVVLGKYLASLVLFALLWAPTVSYIWILAYWAPEAVIDPGAVVTSCLGLLFIGMFYLSLGLLSSALMPNQVSSAFMGFGFCSLTLFSGILPYYSLKPEMQEIGLYLFSFSHLREWSWGIFDTRPMVLYTTLTIWILWAVVKVIESRRWR